MGFPRNFAAVIEAYSDRSLTFAAAQARLARVADTQSAQLAAAQPPRRRVAKGDDLGCAGSGVILSGWACQVLTTVAAARHIFGVLLPGDLVSTDEQGAASMTQMVALSPVEVADLEDSDGVAYHRALDRAERRLTEARRLDQMVRLGGLSALRATGHLVLELHDRLASVGLARNGRFHLPIGQRVIASVLGLSAVHVNRTLQQLSREGLVGSGAGWMAIYDRDGLSELVACPTAFERLRQRTGLTGGAVEDADLGAQPQVGARKVS